MIWYWIVLILIGYMLIWILASVVAYKILEGTDTELFPSIVIGMLWPVMIPFVLVGAIVKTIVEK